MDPKVKKIWTDALRSGKYEQARFQLKVKKDGKWGYCCLGVLCEEAVKAGVPLEVDENDRKDGFVEATFAGSCTVLPKAVEEWAGLSNPNPLLGDYTASHLNDHRKKNFNEIADLIDQHL